MEDSNHRAAGHGLPVFPCGDLPAPEPTVRKLLIRGVALLALVVSLAYLTWRTLYTVDLGGWWVSVSLLALEIHAVFSLGMFTFSLWDITSQQPARRVQATTARIAVLVPTYNEPTEVLLPAIAAAVALRPEHETWVLDDGNRPQIRHLATQLGAHYLARTQHTHGKAGNLNHALDRIDADFVAILDADHIATPSLLTNTLGYFDDPHVALVQTPQEFYNFDSFEHARSGLAAGLLEDRDRYHEQALFYRRIQPGKNRWGAAFWCGTGAVVRVAALREIGGIATETITEDIHTTIRLHRQGWKTVYHNEVLARGLAADTAEQYQLQRFRWGTGAMQVLRVENPLIVPGLRLAQRLAYGSTLLGWFEAWRSLGYLLLPILVLFTGAVPIRAHPVAFGLAFGVTFTLQQIALRLLSRGCHPWLLPIVFDLVRMTPNLLATLALARIRQLKFRVTPKGRSDDQRRRTKASPVLTATALLSVGAAIWFILTVAGLTPLHYDVPWVAYGAASWLTLDLAFIAAAVARIRSMRYGAQRRSSVRFATALNGTLDGIKCNMHNLSLTGALVSIPPSAEVERHFTDAQNRVLTIDLDCGALEFNVVVTSHRRAPDGPLMYALHVVPGQELEQARLTLALLNNQCPFEVKAFARAPASRKPADAARRRPLTTVA
jgi:cellulose synthase/poly-beta-1,6-N-acetylglucosamine synthase-like glycosyltransferase